MPTSGTVATTVISTDQLLEHAWRRCKLAPELQTPELVDTARESLYMLLMFLVSKGLNLWAVDRGTVSLEAGRTTYPLPTGTLSLLNAVFVTPYFATGTDTVAASSVTTELTESQRITRVGVRFSTLPAAPLVVATSIDGITYTTASTIAVADLPAVGDYLWTRLDPSVEATFFRISSAAAFTATDFHLVNQEAELPMSPMNRDQYANQPNKGQVGTPTNYFFEKKLIPQFTLWNAPEVAESYVDVFVHRQLQDVGTLQQQIEVPSRWLDPILTQLSARLALELPGVEDARVAMLTEMADKMVIAIGAEETDGAPIYLMPRIAGYTR